MPRPYSNDLRARVVLAVRSGETCRSVAGRFGVSVASVVKWSQRERTTGSVAPARMGGYRRRVLEPYRDFIVEHVGQTPHLPLHGLKALPAARRIQVSHHTVWTFLRREGLSFKKKRCSLLNRAGRRWPADGGAGGFGRVGLIPGVSCSSTRHGSRPTWPPCAAGG